MTRHGLKLDWSTLCALSRETKWLLSACTNSSMTCDTVMVIMVVLVVVVKPIGMQHSNVTPKVKWQNPTPDSNPCRPYFFSPTPQKLQIGFAVLSRARMTVGQRLLLHLQDLGVGALAIG